jgi:signal transduction histidine kinase
VGSRFGGGTTFTIRLPLDLPEAEDTLFNLE